MGACAPRVRARLARAQRALHFEVPLNVMERRAAVIGRSEEILVKKYKRIESGDRRFCPACKGYVGRVCPYDRAAARVRQQAREREFLWSMPN